MVALGKILSFCYASVVFLFVVGRVLVFLGVVALVALAALNAF